MKVTDNLENYEIPPRFRLTIEEEEELAKDVAEIIPELEKVRNSRLKTRLYFKQHLRYTSNVIDDNKEKGKTENLYEEDESYTPLPGEYTWNSDLLQPVLLDVLEVERLKFGYIVNLLQDDIHARGNIRLKNDWVVSDGLIKFGNEFDIAAIREKVNTIPDIRQRIVYLRTRKADFEVSEYLTFDESNEWGQAFSDDMNELISLEEKKLELYPSGFERPARPEVQVPEERKRPDIFGAALCYKFNEEALVPRFSGYMSKGAESTILAFDRALIDEAFNDVTNELDRFTEECNIYEEDRIHIIFECFDHWLEDFTELVDTAYSAFQKSLKKQLRRKDLQDEREAKEKKGLIMAHFLVEKATVLVSGIKANIMYNHRYVSTPFYNINGGTLEEYMAEREAMSGKFGGGRDKEILFDRDANINAFYEEILDTIRSGLIEASTESDQMDDEERMPTYKDMMKAHVSFDLPIYIEIAKEEEDISTSLYHEAVSWVETTRYCISSVVLAVELWVASDEDRSILFNYPHFQEANFELIPEILNEALLEYKSETGDPTIDDRLNSLGERDADEWDLVVPEFDTNLLTDDFITGDDVEDAIPDDDEEVLEKRKNAIITAAEEAVKKADEILDGPVQIVTHSMMENAANSPSGPLPDYMSCHLRFYDGVEDASRDILYKYIHGHIGKTPGVGEFIFFKVLDDLNYIQTPTFAEVVSEFPSYSESYKNFNHYLGFSGIFNKKLAPKHEKRYREIEAEIQDLLKKK